jgi:arginase
MHLVDGAEAIAGDLPRAATARVEVPPSAGEALDTGIRRFSALHRAAPTLLTAELATGGDPATAVSWAATAASTTPRRGLVRRARRSEHPDASPSGAFAGMALRAVIDDLPWRAAVRSREPCHPRRARELDDAESAALGDSALTHLDVEALADPLALADAVAATGAGAVYVHVDLDVLDPAVIGGVALPVPFGLSLEQLLAALAALRARVPLVGASIAGFAPASPAAAIDDLGTILRVVGALA